MAGSTETKLVDLLRATNGWLDRGDHWRCIGCPPVPGGIMFKPPHTPPLNLHSKQCPVRLEIEAAAARYRATVANTGPANESADEDQQQLIARVDDLDRRLDLVIDSLERFIHCVFSYFALLEKDINRLRGNSGERNT